MTIEFGRTVILVSENTDKYFKYNNHFQIIGLDDTYPKPPKGGIGHFPLVLEYNIDIDEQKSNC